MVWSKDKPHGISGHVYEIIEYYLLLSNHYHVGIMFGDTFTCWNQFKRVILEKYDIDSSKLSQIENATLFCNTPTYVKGSNILIVDGGLKRLQRDGVKLMFDNIIVFKCSKYETIYDTLYENVSVLQDNRVYSICNPEDTDISINYRKKIYFKYFKDIKSVTTDTALIYATSNCRYLSVADLLDITDSYSFKNYLVITDQPWLYDDLERGDIVVKEPPVENLFKKFDTYIYTPLKQVWDGSPRLPAECKYYGKSVIYHKIDRKYLKIDAGLRVRKGDIENNFKDLYLDIFDNLIHIVNSILCKV